MKDINLNKVEVEMLEYRIVFHLGVIENLQASILDIGMNNSRLVDNGTEKMKDMEIELRELKIKAWEENITSFKKNIEKCQMYISQTRLDIERIEKGEKPKFKL